MQHDLDVNQSLFIFYLLSLPEFCAFFKCLKLFLYLTVSNALKRHGDLAERMSRYTFLGNSQVFICHVFLVMWNHSFLFMELSLLKFLIVKLSCLENFFLSDFPNNSQGWLFSLMDFASTLISATKGYQIEELGSCTSWHFFFKKLYASFSRGCIQQNRRKMLQSSGRRK